MEYYAQIKADHLDGYVTDEQFEVVIAKLIENSYSEIILYHKNHDENYLHVVIASDTKIITLNIYADGIHNEHKRSV